MVIGILALQGDFREHEEMLQRMGATTRQVRLPKHLAEVDRLIIPGGESTTISRLLVLYNLLEPLKQRAGRDLPVWGTCAGAIILASHVLDGRPDQATLGVMDMTVQRNAYGRQQESFQTDLSFPVIGDQPMPGVFIRAPSIQTVGPGVDVLSRLSDGTIVAAQQDRLLVTTFHPELTNDGRVHRYFLEV
ncbi:MAG: pyridoxal 5'-phosphate synthase glutaminase subunit PdxT [Chloroflexales bacterium]|nr:pyridoxal 5'-phosphate synthase glutaminase subunit PdxT [Chloroflexales bacterium]